MSALCRDPRSHAAHTAALCLALLAGAGGGGSALAQTPVYRSGFGTGPASGWSVPRIYTAQSGDAMLGRFHNGSVVLGLDALAPHAGVVVAFDLHIIGDWTGERKGVSPTCFSVTLDDAVLLNSSLAIDDGKAQGGRRQSFPDEPGAASHPAGLGAYKVNVLGVHENGEAPRPDAVYRMVFAAPHGARALQLTLAAANLPGTAGDASWAIDNAVVYAVGDTADLDRARAAARDAVTKTALGLPDAFTVAPSPAASPADRLPPAFIVDGGTTFHAGGFEFTQKTNASDQSGQESILSGAMDAQTQTVLPAGPEPHFAMGMARELALVPGPSSFGMALAPSVAAVAAGGRIEQPVVRRVSSLVYQSRFGAGVGPEWDAQSHGVGPRGERFVGPFGNQSATLKLSGIPEHDQLIIDADLYTIGDWPGDGAAPSKVTVFLDGKLLLAESFATENGGMRRTQSYPGAAGGGRKRLPGAEAIAVDTLGYPVIGNADAGAIGDATYHLRFVVPHSAVKGELRFAASGLPASRFGAAWGVDNVTVVSAGDKAMRFADATGQEPDDNADDGTYNNPFVRAPGPEWNVHNFEKSPGGEMYLGGLHNQTAALTVRNFPPHDHMVVGADVVVVGDWQGNTPDPSAFTITLADGTEVCATTFATDNGASDATQDYPDTKHARNLPGAGAYAVGSLGYTDPKTNAPRDAVYRLLFTVPHASANETISFTVKGLRGKEGDGTASWGLDNVVVSSFDSSNLGGGGGGGGTSLGDAGALASGGSLGGGFGGTGAPLGNNPIVPSLPSGGGGGGGGDGGGGGGGGGPGINPTLPTPGALPALLIGAGVAGLRRRR